MKNSPNTDLSNQNEEFGDPKKPEKGQEWIYPAQPLTYVQEYQDITWNTKFMRLNTKI